MVKPARTWLAVLLVAVVLVCLLVLRFALMCDDAARDHARSPATHTRKPHTSPQPEQPAERDTASRAPTACGDAVASPEQADEEPVIRVLVLSPEGTPVKGTQVGVSSRTDPWGRTGSDGRCTITAGPGHDGTLGPEWTGYPAEHGSGGMVRTTQFYITASHPDYAYTRSGPYSRSEPPDEVTITMLRGGRIVGVVVDEAGHPIGGIHIIVTVDAEDAGESLDVLERQTPGFLWADPDGSFTSPTLLPATYLVVADTTYEPYGSGRGEQIAEVAPCEAVKVRVGADETTQNVELVVAGGYTVSGCVLDLDEKPVQGARVSCRDPSRSVLTAEGGSFVLRALPSGEVKGCAWADGCLRRDLSYEPPQADLVIHLLPAPRIAGRVVDKATGQPIEHFCVALQSASRASRYVERDVYDDVFMKGFDSPDGRFELCLDRPDSRTIYVSAPGYATYCAEVVQPRDTLEPDELLVKLVSGAALTVSVNSAVDGSPIAGASISHPAFDVTTVDERVDLDRQCVETGEDGRCFLERIPPGRYRLTVYHSEYESRSQDVEVLEDMTEVAAQFTLGDTFTLRGRVVTDRGAAPVPGVRVRAFAGGADPCWQEPVAQAFTDESGCFEIPGLSQQSCELQADCDDSATVPVSVDLPQALGSETVIEITSTGRVIGSVKTRGGQPVRNASVMYWPSGHAGRVENIGADGQYSVSQIPAGPCLILIEFHSQRLRSAMARSVVVPPADEIRVDFVLGSASVLGEVSRGGELACGGRVLANPKTGAFQTVAGYVAAHIDRSGRYCLENVAPGTYSLEVTASFPSNPRFEAHAASEVTVADADVPFDVNIGNAGRVAGAVKLHNGWPASEARVRLVPRIADGERFARLEQAYAGGNAETRTDDDGVFELPHIPPGQYTLTVTRPGYAVTTVPIDRADERDLTGLDIVLQPEARVLAQLDVADGELPRRVAVSVCDPSSRLLAVHDDVLIRSDGTFEIPNVPPGSYLLSVTADGYAPSQKAVDAPTGDRIRVTLYRGQTASVTVRDRSGSAIPLAVVVLDAGGDLHYAAQLIRSHGLARTDEIGSAQITHVADGAYTVHVQCDGFADAAVPVTIAGQDAAVTVVLERAE
ncbi:MAG: carboxypeptidase regulatory-like domain-containing protein [Verrucomicrobia bacterium]|nr:carboxypeptidase regulatory-like domain-containing protein [Verrucomicrobiota bacterium]